MPCPRLNNRERKSGTCFPRSNHFIRKWIVIPLISLLGATAVIQAKTSCYVGQSRIWKTKKQSRACVAKYLLRSNLIISSPCVRSNPWDNFSTGTGNRILIYPDIWKAASKMVKNIMTSAQLMLDCRPLPTMTNSGELVHYNCMLLNHIRS